MKPVWETFEPRRSPEEALRALRRRMGRRRKARVAALAVASVAVLAVGLWLNRHPPAPPAPKFVVQRVWSGAKDVPYMLYTSESGHAIIFISSPKEDSL